MVEALATITDNYQPLRRRELPYKCSLSLSKLHIGTQMIHTGFVEFSVPGALWRCHRECNIFESLGFMLWWMDAFASRYCCSQRFWVALLHVCMSDCFLLRARGVYTVESIHDELWAYEKQRTSRCRCAGQASGIGTCYASIKSGN